MALPERHFDVSAMLYGVYGKCAKQLDRRYKPVIRQCDDRQL